jgi:hypothetical protein
MNLVADAQRELPLARAARPVQVPIELIRSRKNKGAAFTLACDVSGLEDKEICAGLDMDKAVLSRMKSGSVTLDADQVATFCAVVGNTVYPEWLAYQVGCTLVMVKSEAERRAEAAEARATAAEHKAALLVELLQGKRP